MMSRPFLVKMPALVRRERVAHRLDHVRHGVQAHHVGGSIGGALRAADGRAGERIHLVEAQLELQRVVHRGQHREDTDAVGDEVRRVLRAHHALAERGGEESLEAVHHRRIGVRGRDQLHQLHVTRRVEEVDAAEALLQLRGQCLRKLGDRKARRVGGEDRIGADERCHLGEQVLLPVHALADRLDHEVAAA
jgi:hypothetical protein